MTALASMYIGGVLLNFRPALMMTNTVSNASAVPLSWIGWVATAVFVCSYFAKSAARLRMIQAVAALLWLLYGLAIGALPVIVANAIVAVAAGYSALRRRGKTPHNAASHAGSAASARPHIAPDPALEGDLAH